jgi:hypothetical protein
MPIVRLGVFFALGTFLGANAFALAFAYLFSKGVAHGNFRALFPMWPYAVAVAIALAIVFSLSLFWQRATGRRVSGNMSMAALYCGVAFASPCVLLTFPPILNSQFLETAIFAGLATFLAAFSITGSFARREIDDA